MKPVVIGSIAAAAVVVAFVAGSMMDIDADGAITISTDIDGQAEQLGEAVDQAIE